MRYPNQKHININRTNPLTSGKQYLSIITENVAAAARNLSGEVPFKLFIYLASNADNYSLNFSPQHFANIYGVSLSSAHRAVEKLVDAGYLVEDSEHKNSYIFYEEPQIKEEIDLDLQIEKRRFKQNDGSYIALTYEQIYNHFKGKYSEEMINRYWNNGEEI